VLRLHNDVGTRIWEAGLYLAEILYGCPTLIARKAVIELGAGSGVTSLLTIKNCCSKDRERYLPRRAVITDNMPEVIKNLKYNVALNATAEWTEELPMDSSLTDRSYVYSGTDVASDATPPGTMSASKCVVSTQHLDFNTATEEQCRQLRPDVILVADCTYSEDMHLPLLTVIEKLLCIPTSTSAHPHQHASSSSSTSSSSSSSKSSNLTEELLADAADRGQAVCLLAGTIRHPLTYAHFIDTLTANANLQWHDVTSWAQTVAGEQRYRYDYRDSIRVLLITAKII
jgi:predicted nicotinamide N-methyase